MITIPPMDGQTQKFVDFLMGLPDVVKVFDPVKINEWANGQLGSEDLNKLYADFQAGNLDNVTNWIRGEAGDNQNAPGWANYKQPGLTPEIAYLQNAIAQVTQNKASYLAAGGSDKDLLASIQEDLDTLEQRLEEYQSQQAADLAKVGGK